MSHRKTVQLNLDQFVGAKRKRDDDDDDSNTQTSNKLRHISFDCEIEQMHANEINWGVFFSRFQKRLQSDGLTLISMRAHIESIQNTFTSMKINRLVGGFERKLSEQLLREEDENDKICFKSVELQTECSSRRGATSFSEIRENILNTLGKFLTERFEVEDNLLDKIVPFVEFDQKVDIEEIHGLLAADLSLPNLYMQYNDFATTNTLKGMGVKDIISRLSKTAESRSTYKELITVFARIAAATPHSADVERLISANNLLKTKLRSRLSIETENKYMFIHTNMPNLAEWNPTTAAKMFMDEKNRRNRNMSVTNETTKRQTVFKGVFSEASVCNDDDDENDSEIEASEGDTIFDF